MGRRETEPGAVQGVLGYSGPSHGPVSSGAGSAAGCSHPFACPRPGAGAHGAVRVREAVRRGQSRGRPPRANGRGRQNGDLAPGRWPGRLSCHRFRGPGGSLRQAADLPVAQAVEHQGQEPAGGGDLAMFLASFPRRAVMASLTVPITESRGIHWTASITAQRISSAV